MFLHCQQRYKKVSSSYSYNENSQKCTFSIIIANQSSIEKRVRVRVVPKKSPILNAVTGAYTMANDIHKISIPAESKYELTGEIPLKVSPDAIRFIVSEEKTQ